MMTLSLLKIQGKLEFFEVIYIPSLFRESDTFLAPTYTLFLKLVGYFFAFVDNYVVDQYQFLLAVG